MPVAMSIEWKPLRDSHYIVASLQPDGGGLRQIFIQQSTLREVQVLARGDPAPPVVGLLLGERLDCSRTRTPYVLIESHVKVAVASLDEQTILDAIRTLHAHVRSRDAGDVLGWYCCSRSAEAAVSPTHASVHAACFEERWQTVLILAGGGHSGAFFLNDPTAGRWFHAPFQEVTDRQVSNREAKPTCVAWPGYLTTTSVVPLAETPQRVPLPPSRGFVDPPASARAPRPAGTFARLVVTVRRTPANALAGVGRAAAAARLSVFDLAITFGARAITASHLVAQRIRRIRAERMARAAQRKAEAEVARAREEERRAREAAERRAAREEAQRREAEAAERRAAEAEARRAAEAEARRRAAEEAERRRAAEAELRRQAAEAEARRQAEEAEARRAAEAEAERQAAEEAQRRAAEAEARRIAAEEAQRKAAEEEQRRAAEAEARRQKEAEAEARRQAAEAEAEARRQAAEAEARRLAEVEAQRVAREAQARLLTEEAEALRISLAVTATRARLARPPVEGSKGEAPRGVGAWMADHEDTKASDWPDRYLALAMCEGFEVSVRTQRGSPDHPETFWLLYENESGLRLILVTTDEAVREASLHYNLRTEDDALLRDTAAEHRDLESRTIYVREVCLQDLRARCRRLRAAGGLVRDWKVSPTV